MPIFQCQKCGCVENTALSGFWLRDMRFLRAKREGREVEKGPALCSACDPEIGVWHGEFEQLAATSFGYILGEDGFLYSPTDPARHTRLLGPVQPLSKASP